ncbi:hypothetical protein CEXT_443021 [Caerostris extrusa]|uniref:LAGLIDADG homing endonuclease n=1 Tax=Caerostris extrusa TaxID=172846 RepID=A0AAV4NPQ9_CAEEX|nr:hypothetical protein CEXT_443021 [Caerostris extrusa]
MLIWSTFIENGLLGVNFELNTTYCSFRKRVRVKSGEKTQKFDPHPEHPKNNWSLNGILRDSTTGMWTAQEKKKSNENIGLQKTFDSPRKSVAYLKVLVRVTRNATDRRALALYRTFSRMLPPQNVFRVKSGG